MPVLPDPQPVSAWPHQINVPTDGGVSVTVMIQNDGSGTATPQILNDKLQDLIDYLQQWPGRLPGGDVSGSRYDTLLYAITPSSPTPQPGDEEPSDPDPEVPPTGDLEPEPVPDPQPGDDQGGPRPS